MDQHSNCPPATLERLGVGRSLICPNDMIVRAFNGANPVAVGEIYLKFLIGPCDFDIPAVIVDIPANTQTTP